MCKFHKDVASEIATDPKTGKVDKTKYQIALAALSKWWVEQYIPEVSVSGYSPYEMANSQAQATFYARGLDKPDYIIEGFRRGNMQLLRDAVNAVVQEGNYSFVFKDRIFDKAVKEFYEGNPYEELHLVEKPVSPEFSDFHKAVSSFITMPYVENSLRTMLENNIAKLFQDAPQKANLFLLKQYERHPSFRQVFNACACGVGVSGGFMASHAGCVVSPSLSFVTAAGGSAGSAIAIGTSFSITAVGLYLWHKIRGEVASKTERRLTFASAFLGASLAIGLHLGGVHVGHSDAEHLVEAKAWVAQLPPPFIEGMKENAKSLNMTWDAYLSQEYEMFCRKRDGIQKTGLITLQP